MASANGDQSDDDELFVRRRTPIPSPFHEATSQTGLECDSDDESMGNFELPPAAIQTTSQSIFGGDTKDPLAYTESDRIRSLLTGDLENQDENNSEPDNGHQPESSDHIAKFDKVIIKQESPECEEIMSCFVPAEVIDLSDTEDVPIKQEVHEDVLDWTCFVPGKVIDLSENDDVPIKQEVQEDAFWNTMADEVISIPDSDDENLAVLADETSANPYGSQEGYRTPFATDGDGNDEDVIDFGRTHEHRELQTFGKSILDKDTRKTSTCSDYLARQRERQRMFKERMRAKVSKFGPPASTNKPDGPDTSNIDDHEPNDNSWMTSDTNFDEDAAKIFHELKRSYNAKRKADINTFEDDCEFLRAQKAEKARQKRLELEYAALRGSVSEEEEEDESDEGSLFVGQFPGRRGKRRGPAKKSTQAQKKRKQNQPRKQARYNANKDLERNLLEGIAHYMQKPSEEKGKGKNKKDGENRQTGKSTWAKKDKAPTRKRPTQAGYLNNAASLLNSNVYEDAAANRDLGPLPVSYETNKAKALASMVANVPLGDRRRSEKEHIRRATVTLGTKRVIPDGEGAWKFTGMDSSLRHHQVQGAAWMKERELGNSEPLGGILADGMGLGKTVMALGLCVANKPTHQDEYKATLVVCTPALLNQWEKEIAKHITKGVFRRVMRHHSGNRQSGLGAIEDMQAADIVLTTYHEVMRSYPKTEIPEGVDSAEKLMNWWKSVWEEDRDILHKARFFRVVLDESQAIKNHLSHTSIACRALMAKHRWALSGTPIMNRIEELYPYFKFLRVECTGTFREFAESFCVEGSNDCNKRLHCILDQIMIRRTMKDKVLGFPIVSLPPTHQTTVRLEFNSVERLLYSIICRRFIRALNKASARSDIEKRPSYGFVMLLRLRQMAAHAFLIQEVLQQMFDLDSVDRLEKAAGLTEETEQNKSARDMITALRRMVVAKGQPVENSQDRQSTDPESGAPGELVAQFSQRLQQLREGSQVEELRNEHLCHRCKSIPEDPWVTSCLHVYCKECLEFLLYAAAHGDQDKALCLECGTPFSSSESCSGLKELALNDFQNLSPNLRAKKPKGGKVNMHWVAYDEELVMSAKITAVENQIKQWLEEQPDKKVIVFSQFLMMSVFQSPNHYPT